MTGKLKNAKHLQLEIDYYFLLFEFLSATCGRRYSIYLVEQYNIQNLLIE